MTFVNVNLPHDLDMMVIDYQSRHSIKYKDHAVVEILCRYKELMSDK